MAWWDRVRGWARPQDDVPYGDRQRAVDTVKAEPIAACCDRSRVTVRGTIDVLTVRARHDTPWLEAELSDGTGRLTLIWMGRHEIPGIEMGRELLASGRISVAEGVRRLYNPDYELL